MGLDSRHERGAERVEEKSGGGSNTAKSSSQASAAGQKRGKPGHRGEEEGDQDEHPAEAPHIVVILARGIAAMAADETVRSTIGAAIPGLAKGRSRPRRAAVVVVLAAEVEVRPLGDIARSGDAGSVGAQEVDLVERRDVADARENNEP